MSHDKAQSQNTAISAETSQSFIDPPSSEISLTLEQKQKVELVVTDCGSITTLLTVANKHVHVLTGLAAQAADHVGELGRILLAVQKYVRQAKTDNDPRLTGIPAGAAFYYICRRQLGLSSRQVYAAINASIMGLETLNPLASPKLRRAAEKRRAKTNNTYLAKIAVQEAVEPSPLPLPVAPAANVESPSPTVTPPAITPACLIPKLVPVQPVEPSKLTILLAPLIDPAFEQRRATNTLTMSDVALVATAASLGLFFAQKVAAGHRLKFTGYVPKKQPIPSNTQQLTLGI